MKMKNIKMTKLFFFATLCTVVLAMSCRKPDTGIKNLENTFAYARPNRNALILALREHNAVNEHPRLYARKADFDAIRLKVQTNPVKDWYARILSIANDAITGNTQTPYAEGASIGVAPITRYVPRRIYNLSLAFQISGEQKYADRAYKEMASIANWNNWATTVDRADIMNAFSVGYDWCYSGMTADQRTLVKNAIVNKGLKPLLDDYNQNPNYTFANGQGSVFASNNFNPWINGAGFACAVAVADGEADLAGEIMERALRGLENFAGTFGPDGSSTEGVGYGNGSMTDYINLIAVMESALGSSYNYFDVQGIAQYPYFPVYLNGPVKSLNFHDSGTDDKQFLSVAFFCANKLNQPLLGSLRESAIANNETQAGVFDILWYKQPYNVSASENLPLDKYFRGYVQTGSFRSSFTDPNATFLAFHAGENNVSHRHLDIGQFNIDAKGLNWALDLGTEKLSYDPAGATKYLSRDDLYRINSGGHNTLLIDPSHFDGQSGSAYSPVTQFSSTAATGFAVVDMTAAYRTQATKAFRGFKLTNNRSTIIIQDELELKKASDVWWFMHTRANIEVSADGKSAILSQGGKNMYARLISPANGIFLALKAEPLPNTMQNAFQTPNTGIQKLTVKVPEVTNTVIVVEIAPESTQALSTLVPLNKWSQ